MYTEDEKAVACLIRKLGITSRYRGYYYLIDATSMYLQMIRDKESAMITKDVYPAIASKYKGVTVRSVERNIRTIASMCWRNNRGLLNDIAGCILHRRPTNSEFLDMLAYYIENTK